MNIPFVFLNNDTSIREFLPCNNLFVKQTSNSLLPRPLTTSSIASSDIHPTYPHTMEFLPHTFTDLQHYSAMLFLKCLGGLVLDGQENIKKR